VARDSCGMNGHLRRSWFKDHLNRSFELADALSRRPPKKNKEKSVLGLFHYSSAEKQKSTDKFNTDFLYNYCLTYK
jgi:hypothetical protein